MVSPIRHRSVAHASPSRSPHPQPVAATATVASRLEGERRTAEIVSRSRHAVYVRDPDAEGDAPCHLAILSREAVAVPCGLVTGRAEVGDVRHVILGDRRCTVDGTDLRVTRFLRSAAPPVSDAAARTHRLPTAALLREVLDALPGTDSAYEALADDDPYAVDLLLGRGPGLTPLGDDVLAGWLVTCAARGRPDTRTAAAVTTHAPTRTTAVSSALLLHARKGEAVPALQALLGGLGQDQQHTRLDALRAVGHTSGTGLALGVALACR